MNVQLQHPGLGTYSLLINICQEDAVVAVHVLLYGVVPVFCLHQAAGRKRNEGDQAAFQQAWGMPWCTGHQKT